MGTPRTKVDTEHNRLYLIFSGMVTKKKMESFYTDVRFAVADLSPGFDVISDFTACNVIHLNSIPPLRKIMSYLLEFGLGEIVRVIREEQVSYKQLLNLTMQIQGYHPLYVHSCEEVEPTLDAIIRRKGVRISMRDIPVQCRYAGEVFVGRLVDISISGCAVSFATRVAQLQVGASCTLAVRFEAHQLEERAFSLEAKAIWMEEDRVGMQFIGVDEATQKQIWNCLLVESRY